MGKWDKTWTVEESEAKNGAKNNGESTATPVTHDKNKNKQTK